MKEKMRKKIPQATIRRIQSLARKEYDAYSIAEAEGVSITAVRFYTGPRYERFESLMAYHEHLAELNGYASRSEYQREADAARSQRKKYREVSKLVHDILRQQEKNQSWLANYLGVSRQAVSFYAQGKRMPSNNIYQKLRELRNKTAPSPLEEKLRASD